MRSRGTLTSLDCAFRRTDGPAGPLEGKTPSTFVVAGDVRELRFSDSRALCMQQFGNVKVVNY